MDKLFASHDKDMNGKLSWREFVGEESKNERVFKLLDANKDGKISKPVSMKQFAKYLNFKKSIYNSPTRVKRDFTLVLRSAYL